MFGPANMLRRLSYRFARGLSVQDSRELAAQSRVSGLQGLCVAKYWSSGPVSGSPNAFKGSRTLWHFGKDEKGAFALPRSVPTHETRAEATLKSHLLFSARACNARGARCDV